MIFNIQFKYTNYTTYDIIVNERFNKRSEEINGSFRMYNTVLVIFYCHMLQNQQSHRHLLCTVIS